MGNVSFRWPSLDKAQRQGRLDQCSLARTDSEQKTLRLPEFCPSLTERVSVILHVKHLAPSLSVPVSHPRAFLFVL